MLVETQLTLSFSTVDWGWPYKWNLYFFLCPLAPSTPSSLPEHPSSSSSLTDSDHEREQTTPSTPQTPPACPSQRANQDVAEMHLNASQETQRKDEFNPQTHSSGDPGLFQTHCRHFQEFHIKWTIHPYMEVLLSFTLDQSILFMNNNDCQITSMKNRY